jgi:hypothetical protein
MFSDNNNNSDNIYNKIYNNDINMLLNVFIDWETVGNGTFLNCFLK